jgi:hypothetical protein
MNSIDAPRPLNLGEILDRTVQLYRERFLVFLGIAVIPTGVLLVFAGSMFLALAWFGAFTGTSSSGSLNSPTTAVFAVLIVGVLSLVAVAALLGVSSLSTAAINYAAAGALAGERLTIRGSFAQAWRRGWMYVGLHILQALIVWVAPFIVWSVAFTFLTALLVGLSRGASGQAADLLIGLTTIFGFAAVAGFALWMLLCVGLAFPACVVEGIDAGRSLIRSFRLSKGTRGRIFVLYLLGFVLGIILSIVVSVIFLIAVALVPALNSPQNSQALGMAMIFLIYGSSFAVQAFTKPVYAIALMLFYYDQRIRNEGFDIEWMMERAGLVAAETTATNADPTTAPSVEWMTTPIEMETSRDGGDAAAAEVRAATQATERTDAIEPPETTQPESRVQE